MAFSFAFCTLYKTWSRFTLRPSSFAHLQTYFHVIIHTIRCAIKYCVRSKHLCIRYTCPTIAIQQTIFLPGFCCNIFSIKLLVSDDSAVYGRKKRQKNHRNFKYYKFNLPFANYKLIWKIFFFSLHLLSLIIASFAIN